MLIESSSSVQLKPPIKIKQKSLAAIICMYRLHVKFAADRFKALMLVKCLLYVNYVGCFMS